MWRSLWSQQSPSILGLGCGKVTETDHLYHSGVYPLQRILCICSHFQSFGAPLHWRRWSLKTKILYNTSSMTSRSLLWSLVVVIDNCTFKTILVSFDMQYALHQATNGTQVPLFNLSSSAQSYTPLAVSALEYDSGSDVNCLAPQYPPPLCICWPAHFGYSCSIFRRLTVWARVVTNTSGPGGGTWLGEDTLTNYTAAPKMRSLSVTSVSSSSTADGPVGNAPVNTALLFCQRSNRNVTALLGYRALWEWASRTASSILANQKSADHKRHGFFQSSEYQLSWTSDGHLMAGTNSPSTATRESNVALIEGATGAFGIWIDSTGPIFYRWKHRTAKGIFLWQGWPVSTQRTDPPPFLMPSDQRDGICWGTVWYFAGWLARPIFW